MRNKRQRTSIVGVIAGLLLVAMHVYGPINNVQLMDVGLLITVVSTGTYAYNRREE